MSVAFYLLLNSHLISLKCFAPFFIPLGTTTFDPTGCGNGGGDGGSEKMESCVLFDRFMRWDFV